MPPLATQSRPQRWLTLGEASRFLGVDASTLRAWADAGRLQMFRTPGGHRRFAQDELLAFLQRSRGGREVRLADLIGPHGGRLVPGNSRAQIRQQEWYAALDTRTTAAMRTTCHHLMRAMAVYLVGGRRQSAHLREGARAGRALGQQVAAMRLPPAAATRAFLFFRGMITDAVSAKLPLSPDHKVRSIRRLDVFLNQVLLEMMQAYQKR